LLAKLTELIATAGKVGREEFGQLVRIFICGLNNLWYCLFQCFIVLCDISMTTVLVSVIEALEEALASGMEHATVQRHRKQPFSHLRQSM